MKTTTPATPAPPVTVYSQHPSRSTASAAAIATTRVDAVLLVGAAGAVARAGAAGLFRAYPEMAGRGDGALAGRYFAHKTGAQHRVPDASQPALVTVLTEWLEEIAADCPEGMRCVQGQEQLETSLFLC